MEIRRLSAEDWAVLREIRLRALVDAPYAFGARLDEARSRTERQWRARLTGRTQFLATAAGGPVGVVAVEQSGDGAAHVMSMWIEPRSRGTGIVGALIEAVIGWAAQRGCPAVRLEVTEGNERAEHVYARHGFARTGRVGIISVDDPRREFEMVRLLDNS